MKTLENLYKIELTADEIEIITTALHDEYKFYKEKSPDTIDESKIICDKIQSVRTIRNEFARLINRSYMGYDA